MRQSDIPAKILAAWANAASSTYVNPNIPLTTQQSSSTPNRASYADGFPPLTDTPVAAGGKGPKIIDMNGILQVFSKWIIWQESGAPVYYDSAFSSAIGGYPMGATLSSTTLGYQWYNTVDNNMTDPDGGSASGWVAYRGIKINRIRLTAASGTYTSPAGLLQAEIRLFGGGGGGGAAPGTGSTGSNAAGGGGGAGGEAYAILMAAQIGASQAYVCGSAGAGAVVNGASASTGGTTSFGSGLLLAYGGAGGVSGVISAQPAYFGGGVGGSYAGSLTQYGVQGQHGNFGLVIGGSSVISSGIGGWGGANRIAFGGSSGFQTDPGGVAPSAQGYGAGGAGAGATTVDHNGGSGGAGCIDIIEYILGV